MLRREHGSKEAWKTQLMDDKGPVMLHRLCRAAQESGQTNVHVSASDFDLIWAYYEAK